MIKKIKNIPNVLLYLFVFYPPVSFILQNLWVYFDATSLSTTALGFYVDVGNIFPPYKFHGFIFYLIWMIASWLLFMKLTNSKQSPIIAKPDLESTKTFTYGVVGTIAMLLIYPILQRELVVLAQRFQIDELLRNATEATFDLDYSGYSPLADTLSGSVMGATEEVVFTGIVLWLLIKKAHINTSISLIIMVVIRGVIHLHMGSITSLLFMAPLAVFTALYFIKTHRILPLFLGHFILNFVLISNMSKAKSSIVVATQFIEHYLFPLILTFGIIWIVTKNGKQKLH